MNVVPLEITGFAPTNDEIARHLRRIAEWVEEGQYGDLRQSVLVLETAEGAIKRVTCGQVCDLARVVGLLTVAAHRAMTGDDQ